MLQADALMGQEKYEQAISYLEKAEGTERFNIDIQLSKGVAYANMDDLENAKKEFEKALKINKKKRRNCLFPSWKYRNASGKQSKGN